MAIERTYSNRKCVKNKLTNGILTNKFKCLYSSWVQKLLSWSAFSAQKLETSEKLILSSLKTPWRGFYVEVKTLNAEICKIWTVAMNEQSKEIPLLYVHGLGAGMFIFLNLFIINVFNVVALGLWLLNFDDVAKNRPVYAIDLPGFGKSSRIEFLDEAILVEQQYVKIVEDWRVKMNISKMNICGHSMGGLIGFSYAISFPQNVQHLILADPWGLTPKPINKKRNNSNISDKIGSFFSKIAYPITILRMFGPFSQWIVEFTFPEMVAKLTAFVGNKEIVIQYMHQINLQTPTGEGAFKTMMDEFYWVQHPLVKRIDSLSETIPITLIWAEYSALDKIDEGLFGKLRSKSYVKIHTVKGVGHEFFAYNSIEFNDLINESCALKIINKKL